jgi:hypothetical protein
VDGSDPFYKKKLGDESTPLPCGIYYPSISDSKISPAFKIELQGEPKIVAVCVIALEAMAG